MNTCDVGDVGIAGIDALKSFLKGQEIGSIVDTGRIRNLLADCWDEFQGNDATSMQVAKLWRIEQPAWEPPRLEFWIQRYDQTVFGSTRVTVYKLRLDVQALTAEIVEEKSYPMDKRIDVKSIAESLAEAIIAGRADPRLRIVREGCIRLNIGLIIPETIKATKSARRKRLRQHLNGLLGPYGWREDPVHWNVYSKSGG
jgi:hypothetical protein